MLSITLDEATTQEEKEVIVANIFFENESVAICNEWMQIENYTTIDGQECYRPVNVLVQTWDKPEERV